MFSSHNSWDYWIRKIWFRINFENSGGGVRMCRAREAVHIDREEKKKYEKRYWTSIDDVFYVFLLLAFHIFRCFALNSTEIVLKIVKLDVPIIRYYMISTYVQILQHTLLHSLILFVVSLKLRSIFPFFFSSSYASEDLQKTFPFATSTCALASCQIKSSHFELLLYMRYIFSSARFGNRIMMKGERTTKSGIYLIYWCRVQYIAICIELMRVHVEFYFDRILSMAIKGKEKYIWLTHTRRWNTNGNYNTSCYRGINSMVGRLLKVLHIIWKIPNWNLFNLHHNDVYVTINTILT